MPFNLNILNYSEVSDFLLFAFKNPFTLICCIILLGFAVYYSVHLKRRYIYLSLLIVIFIFPILTGGLSGCCAKQYIIHGENKCGCLFPFAGRPDEYTMYIKDSVKLQGVNYLLSTHQYLIFAHSTGKDDLKVEIMNVSAFIRKTKRINWH